MTNEMREYVLDNIERSKGNLTIGSVKETIRQKEREIEFWKSHSYAWESETKIAMAKKDIQYFEAVIEILTEMEEIKVADETVKTVIQGYNKFNKTTLIRKAVASMANKLRKIGYSLSNAFKKAWSFVKVLTGMYDLKKQNPMPMAA